jgi:hypothetical protein
MTTTATERFALIADQGRQLGSAFDIAAVVRHFNGEFSHGV